MSGVSKEGGGLMGHGSMGSGLSEQILLYTIVLNSQKERNKLRSNKAFYFCSVPAASSFSMYRTATK